MPTTSFSSSSGLQGWHPGERISRAKTHFDAVPSTANLFHSIRPELDYDSASFYVHHLAFFPVTTLDAQGRPWGSLLCSKDGKGGLVESTGYSQLRIRANVWEGDPISENLKGLENDDPRGLLAGIGVEFSTRRRNKVAGRITDAVVDGTYVEIELTANQALGNCPKYITIRSLEPAKALPRIVSREMQMEKHSRLPEDVISFIKQVDTTFLATSYTAPVDEAERFPSHVGMNHRGGRPGFVRVKPSDGRTVVLPDFSGNRFMTSLGNVEATPLAGLTFVNFATGDILMLTGVAKNLYGEEAQTVMPFQDRLTEIYTTGYVFVHDALPVRESSKTPAQPSPYSPPVRLLAEESKSTAFLSKDNEQPAKATLLSIELHTDTLATFKWQSTRAGLEVKPGQAIILDFTPLLGTPQYQHMSPMRPSAVNDDLLRTWTVSDVVSNNSEGKPTFSLTMKRKEGGFVTGALFSIAQRMKEVKPELLKDARGVGMNVGIVGVTGEFTLPSEITISSDLEHPASSPSSRRPRLLWIAGGIGITPFLSMLRALSMSGVSNVSDPESADGRSSLSSTPSTPPWDVHFVLSTREPSVLIPLIERCLNPGSTSVKLSLYVFSSTTEAVSLGSDVLEVKKHVKGRISPSFFQDKELPFEFGGASESAQDTMVAVCGPREFEERVVGVLKDVGYTSEIQRESFSY